MLVGLKEILGRAQAGGFAIPAFNVYNMETVMGVIQAAEEKKGSGDLPGVQQTFYTGRCQISGSRSVGSGTQHLCSGLLSY